MAYQDLQSLHFSQKEKEGVSTLNALSMEVMQNHEKGTFNIETCFHDILRNLHNKHLDPLLKVIQRLT